MLTISPVMMQNSLSSAVSARDTEKLDASRSFQSMLARAEGPLATTEETAREAAEQLISVSLVQPIFEQLRASSQAAPPFGRGEAEKTFGPLLDAELSRRLTSRSNWPLVNELAKRLTARLEAGKQEATV